MREYDKIFFCQFSFVNFLLSILDSLQNTTIEERVTLLEIQVTDIREDLTTTEGNVADLDQDVNFLFDEQVIQDERLFSLEQTSLGILGELDSVEDELESEFIKLIYGQ